VLLPVCNIDMTMYEFSDTTAEHDLAAAVLTSQYYVTSRDFWSWTPAGPTSPYQVLQFHRRLLHPREGHRGRPRHRHGKVFTGSENFSSSSLNDNRELGLIISSHAVMSAIASTFAADFRNGQHWP
jgi:hypothetical protein